MIFETMQIEPHMPDRPKVRFQTKRDTGFIPWTWYQRQLKEQAGFLVSRRGRDI